MTRHTGTLLLPLLMWPLLATEAASTKSTTLAAVRRTHRNVDAWYDAFGVKPGDKYYLSPDKRVHLW